MTRVDRVFIDTNELFPFTVMDLLLTLSEDRLLDWVWTDEALDEWERVIVRERRRSPEAARSVSAAIRQGFASTRLEPKDYRHLISDDLSPDAADRAHAAACIGGHVDVLITRNIRDFRSHRLADAGVRVMTADDYLANLMRRRRRAVQDACVRLAATRTRPAMSPCELLEQIRRAGAPTFASRLGRRLGCR